MTSGETTSLSGSFRTGFGQSLIAYKEVVAMKDVENDMYYEEFESVSLNYSPWELSLFLGVLLNFKKAGLFLPYSNVEKNETHLKNQGFLEYAISIASSPQALSRVLINLPWEEKAETKLGILFFYLWYKWMSYYYI